MTAARYRALMGNQLPLPDLTPEELALGWHWCAEWDGLLVGPSMRETEACSCFGVPS